MLALARLFFFPQLNTEKDYSIFLFFKLESVIGVFAFRAADSLVTLPDWRANSGIMIHKRMGLYMGQN